MGEDRRTLANWVSLEIGAEIQTGVQGLTPRDRSAGPAALALGSSEGGEVRALVLVIFVLVWSGAKLLLWTEWGWAV